MIEDADSFEEYFRQVKRLRPQMVSRVLIVDDHLVVAEGLRLVLNQNPDIRVVGIAGDAREALELSSRTHPDVMLVDYMLPDATGVELAAWLRDRRIAVPLVLLGTDSNNAILRDAVKAGARGYLLKTLPAREVVEAVRRVAAGEMLIEATTLAELIAGYDDRARLLGHLTPREREVLRLLAEGLGNRGIAARMGIGYVTVRSHVRNLSGKLDAHSRLELVARASELGLIVRSRL